MGQDKKQREDELIYADDTNALTTKDKPQDARTRLKNYGIVTKGRIFCIQWKKVQILTQQTKKTQEEKQRLLQEPCGKIQRQKTALAIWKQIYAENKTKAAVRARLKQENSNGGIRNKVFLNKKPKRKHNY